MIPREDDVCEASEDGQILILAGAAGLVAAEERRELQLKRVSRPVGVHNLGSLATAAA